MCGRFTLTSVPDSFAEDFDLDEVPEIAPRYNIAPTQNVLAIRRREGPSGNEVVALRWGLLPSWSRGPTGAPLINARAETIGRKPSFREPFESRRCLVPADGYYEWKSAGGYKQPWHIRLQDRRLFVMAGLWDRWTDPAGTELRSCAIVTTVANSLTDSIHDRMPVILGAGAARTWLDPETDADALTGLLLPFPSDLMEIEAVNPGVNSVAHDGPECLRPADVNLELGL